VPGRTRDSPTLRQRTPAPLDRAASYENPTSIGVSWHFGPT